MQNMYIDIYTYVSVYIYMYTHAHLQMCMCAHAHTPPHRKALECWNPIMRSMSLAHSHLTLIYGWAVMDCSLDLPRYVQTSARTEKEVTYVYVYIYIYATPDPRNLGLEGYHIYLCGYIYIYIYTVARKGSHKTQQTSALRAWHLFQ